MAGRASGRARGLPPASVGDSPTSMGSGSSPGSPGNGSAAAFRGRGGFRPESQLVTRPPQTTATTGTSGRPIPLFANFFKVETDSTISVYDYRVDIEAAVERVKIANAIIAETGHLFPGSDGQPAFLFDGWHNLKAMTRLEDETTIIPVAKEGVQYTVTFKRSPDPVAWGSFEMMRLYNTQNRRNFQHLKWMLIYRNYYDPATTISLPEWKLKVSLGLATATALHDSGILMCCDTINKIVRTETVYDQMKQIFQRGGRDNFQDNMRREVCGSIVMTTYNNRTYKIDDVDFQKNPMSTFEWRGRGNTTFVQYYKEVHNLTVNDAGQPLIICLPSAREKRIAEQRGWTVTPQLLIPEFCVLTGLSESLRGDFNLKKKLTQSTQLPPPDRFQQLIKFRSSLGNNADVRADMEKWKLNFGQGLVDVQGRLLPNEALLMAGRREIPIKEPGDFSKEMRGVAMLTANGWKEWVVIHLNRDGPTVQSFLNALNRVSTGLGLKLGAPQVIAVDDDRTATYIGKLRQWMGPDVAKQQGLAICVFPNNNSERYSAIKKQCLVETPVGSQCVLTKTLEKQQQLMSVATKICLQMACKMGDTPWTVKIPAKEVMIIGYDTYHDGTRRRESVGAFVCSLNSDLSQYYSHVSYHTDNNEMSNNIAANLRKGLEKYEKRNAGALPKRIIVFRDGVGEGMIRHVYEVEVVRMQNVLESFAGNQPGVNGIEMAVIIVTKRMNVKFFWKNLVQNQKRLENPPPGTVIDTIVTRPERLEYYLVAQSVRAGTVAPTNFNIICNSTQWKPEHFQMLTYKLCHLYYNWPGTIRVPAPCQYAHKMAFLTGTALHREPHQDLCNRLFFL